MLPKGNVLCPKEMYFGSDSVNRALTSAVLQWNVSASGRNTMMARLHLPIGSQTEKAMTLKINKQSMMPGKTHQN